MTPFSDERAPMPGVEIQANVIDAILKERWIRRTPIWLLSLATAVIAMGAAVLYQFVDTRLAALLMVVLIAATVAAHIGSLPLRPMGRGEPDRRLAGPVAHIRSHAEDAPGERRSRPGSPEPHRGRVPRRQGRRQDHHRVLQRRGADAPRRARNSRCRAAQGRRQENHADPYRAVRPRAHEPARNDGAEARRRSHSASRRPRAHRSGKPLEASARGAGAPGAAFLLSRPFGSSALEGGDGRRPLPLPAAQRALPRGGAQSLAGGLERVRNHLVQRVALRASHEEERESHHALHLQEPGAADPDPQRPERRGPGREVADGLDHGQHRRRRHRHRRPRRHQGPEPEGEGNPRSLRRERHRAERGRIHPAVRGCAQRDDAGAVQEDRRARRNVLVGHPDRRPERDGSTTFSSGRYGAATAWSREWSRCSPTSPSSRKWTR